MHHEILTYQADGLTMQSQLFFEPGTDSGPRAGVLVFPEAFGLGAHAISRAERLAGMGYVALACDLHGDGRVIEDLQAAPKTDAKAITGKVLVCIGADDPMISAEQRAVFDAEMREAGVDWQMHLYGGTVHSFTNQEAGARNMPDAIRYSAEADARSWAAMQQLFSETLVG